MFKKLLVAELGFFPWGEAKHNKILKQKNLNFMIKKLYIQRSFMVLKSFIIDSDWNFLANFFLHS